MKKILALISISVISTLAYSQTKLEISQTNPLNNILSYNLEYINQAQKILNFHQQFMVKIANGNRTTSYLQLDDVRGAKVGIISNLEMPVLDAGLISFDNQQLKYVVNTERSNQLLSSSCSNIKKFLSQEPIKINNILSSNLDLTINIYLKDGYKVHIKYTC